VLYPEYTTSVPPLQLSRELYITYGSILGITIELFSAFEQERIRDPGYLQWIASETERYVPKVPPMSLEVLASWIISIRVEGNISRCRDLEIWFADQ
jgi:hypothetical protein